MANPSDSSACGGGTLPPPPKPDEPLRQLPGRELLIAFDFDGTLVLLAPSPGAIQVPPTLPSHLHRVAARATLHGVRVMLCTGRAVADIERYVPAAPGLDVIGNHGLEWKIWQEGRAEHRDLTPPEWAPWRKGFLEELTDIVAREGGMIEDKVFSLTLHYRRSGTEFWSGPKGRAWLEQRMPQSFTQLLEGKACWNILAAGASKGEAVARYMRETGCRKLIYFGDEPTDETVFARQELDVLGVKVGEGATAARYGLPDVDSVRGWLAELSAIQL